MSEDILVPDEYIIDFSLTKEEIKKQLDDYEKACNEAFKKLGLLEDYPHNLTPEEKEIFDKENPYWKEFFKERIK